MEVSLGHELPLRDVISGYLRQTAVAVSAESATVVLADSGEIIASAGQGTSVPLESHRHHRKAGMRDESIATMSAGEFQYLQVPLHFSGYVFGSLCFRRRSGRSDWSENSKAELSACAVSIESCLADAAEACNRVGSSPVEVIASRGLVHESRSMALLEERMGFVASAECHVLLLGESGTGKEVVARAIHLMGPRRDSPFVPLNCGAIPDGLVESELFGYRTGAFSGANSDKKGVLEESDGGTLFLDEIANASPGFQAKLLRTIESGEFRRLGDTRFRKVDFRIIAATNADLESLIKDGRFRDDLYYRLNVVTLRIPPLRERLDDVPVLAQHFAQRFCRARGWPYRGIGSSALSRLRAYDWPGNVRELEHAIEHSLVVSHDGMVRRDALPDKIKGSVMDEIRDLLSAGGVVKAEYAQQAARIPSESVDPNNEPHLVLDALRRSGGDKSAAARLLGWNRMRLYRALRRYGIPYK
jgi:transcriptional regulator with GAF, ATPase, and Fis domain